MMGPVMIGRKRVFKVYAAVFLVFALMFSVPAHAGSAVAYGVKTVHTVADADSRLSAVRKVLETCSDTDSHCRLLVACESGGYGAAVSEQRSGHVVAIGAVCGLSDFDTARRTAREKCAAVDGAKACELRASWHDTADSAAGTEGGDNSLADEPSPAPEAAPAGTVSPARLLPTKGNAAPSSPPVSQD